SLSASSPLATIGPWICGYRPGCNNIKHFLILGGGGRASRNHVCGDTKLEQVVINRLQSMNDPAHVMLGHEARCRLHLIAQRRDGPSVTLSNWSLLKRSNSANELRGDWLA
ncbi:hypothetical protein KXV75_009142, partial [Aspergillus fumigatus]